MKTPEKINYQEKTLRNINVVEFISLDGVIQAPGGPGEDSSGAFKYGGWLVPYSDSSLNEALKITYGRPYDLLLGKKTYDIFAAYWPNQVDSGSDPEFAKQFNECKKYVATHSSEKLLWKNSFPLGKDIIQNLKEIKESGDKNLLVVGSSDFVHTLLAHDLVDELHLYMAPIILGKGKRLFDETSKPAAFKLTRSVTSESGMILMNYVRAGEVMVGSFGP